MKFQAFHVNPGEKLKKKDVNNDLSNFMSVFPISKYYLLKGFLMPKLFKCVNRNTLLLKANISNMYKCTLYLNHQVTKSFVKDC